MFIFNFAVALVSRIVTSLEKQADKHVSRAQEQRRKDVARAEAMRANALAILDAAKELDTGSFNKMRQAEDEAAKAYRLASNLRTVA